MGQGEVFSSSKHEETCRKLLEILYHVGEDARNLQWLQEQPELQGFLEICSTGHFNGVKRRLELSLPDYEDASEEHEICKEDLCAKLIKANQDKENLTARMNKCEYQLESERCQWNKEKASLQKLLLERNTFLVADLACEKRKNKELLAAVKKAEQQAESRTIKCQQDTAEQQAKNRAIEWQQEKSSLKTRLKELKEELHHTKLRHTILVQKREDETALMFEKMSLSQNTLLQQRQETIEITRVLKSTTDQLEKERLHNQELSSQLETAMDHCVDTLDTQEKAHGNLIATLKKKSEDELESERLLWQQEKSFLLQETQQIHQRPNPH